MLRFRGLNNGTLVYETDALSTWPWGQEKRCQKILLYLLILIDRHSFLWKSIDNHENPCSREGPKYESQRSYSEKNGWLKYLVLGWFGVHRGPKAVSVQKSKQFNCCGFICTELRCKIKLILIKGGWNEFKKLVRTICL